MLGKLARLGLLAAAAVLSVASAARQGQPQGPPQQGPPQYGQGASYAPPTEPSYFCTLLRTATTQGSLCLPTFERCERERVEMPPVPIASRDIRRAVAAGEPFEKFVPAGVAEYIRRNSLYGYRPHR